MHHRPMTELDVLADARTATLATIAADGSPHLVPVCFVVLGDPAAIYTPLDEKPKRVSDPHDLERVRDIVANPEVAVLVHRWSEDWSQLGWLRVRGLAQLVEPGSVAAATGEEHRAAVEALRAKYPQYRGHRLEDRPIIRIVPESTRSWGSLSPAKTTP
jgi:PPOX class probable F420-dependent enzyme